MARRKWLVRKQNGKWLVYRPDMWPSMVYHVPIEFDSFAMVLAWKPDCPRFLAGLCSCRFECGR